MRNIEFIMMESQHCQNISLNLALDTQRMRPLIKGLKYNEKLVELNLSSNKLDDAGTTELCASLKTLLNLQVLNLSNNRLTSKFIEALETCEMMLPSLKKLHLSFNPLGDSCASSVIRLCRQWVFSLEELYLSSCLLTSKFWLANKADWQSLLEERQSLKMVDLSHNYFGKDLNIGEPEATGGHAVLVLS